MGRNGSVNVKELENFTKKLEESFTGSAYDRFLESCAKELAARLLAMVIKKTPVGEYPEGSGKVGGTLRRGWTGGKNSAGAAYAQSLKVTRSGGAYVIEIINPVEYASYVEFGHRTRNHDGWVEGKHMLALSEEELQRIAPKVLERKIEKELGKRFNGK